MRMRGLLGHAASLGVSVHVAHLEPPLRGFYDADNGAVVYDFNLTPIERLETLAHELGHVFYDHRCYGERSFEEAADAYAAHLLIDPAEFARAERVCADPESMAEELGVSVHMLRVFQQNALVRLRGVTYARARMGAGQYRHVWVG